MGPLAVSIAKSFYDLATKKEQQKIVEEVDFPVRKLAHMTEFATLGGLIFLLLSTWQGKLLPRYLGALGITFLYACSDEWHQKFSGGRIATLTDAFIDLLGATVACSAILAVLVLLRDHTKKGHSQKP